MDFQHRILPFYMTYQEMGGRYPQQYSQPDAVRDLEYLQQLYPYEVRRYQKRVAEILDKMDYEGSMIYDEYPDRFGLERLVDTVWNIIRKEEESPESDISQSPETWGWIKALLFVLLNTEVYKRRNGRRRRFHGFY